MHPYIYVDGTHSVSGNITYTETTNAPQQVQGLIERSYPDAGTIDRAFIVSYENVRVTEVSIPHTHTHTHTPTIVELDI